MSGVDIGGAARSTARDPSRSAWVTANAGSGKTTVLVDRVARLLLAGAAPERILCLTYTKTAAAEMTRRLADRLGDWSIQENILLAEDLARLTGASVSEGDLARARQLFAHSLESPGGLRIETIHAFAARALRRFPVEAGLLPDFKVLDEAAAVALAERAFMDALLAAESAPPFLGAVASALAAASAATVQDALIQALSERHAMRNFLRDAAPTGGHAVRIRQFLGLEPDETQQTILADAVADKNCDRQRLAEAIDVLRPLTKKTDRERHEAIRAFLAAPIGPEAFIAYATSYATKDGMPLDKTETADARKAASWIGPYLKGEQARVMAWLDRLKAAEFAAQTEDALEIFDAVEARYRALLRAENAVDYADLVARLDALLSLETPDWVHFKLDNGIDHVLVDEAQDTSRTGWSIIRKLTGIFFDDKIHRASRTLFVVGDEKQSIFRFQGAAPEQFESMRAVTAKDAKAARRPFSSVAFPENFRSAPEILEIVDRVFNRADWQEAVAPGRSSIAHIAERRDLSGAVELWEPIPSAANAVPEIWSAPVDLLPENSAAALLASRIAAEIAAWLHPETGRIVNGRRLEAGDILILVSARGPVFHETVRKLREAALPVAGADRILLRAEAAFIDLLSLARWGAMAGDDLALAEVLRSPFCNLGEEALFALAHGRTGSLWRRVEAAGDVPKEALRRLRLVRALAGRALPFEFFVELLDGEGNARKDFLTRLGEDSAEPIEEMIRLALAYEREPAPSLDGFLAWVLPRANEVKREVEEPAGKIRIMTIHHAKGLEAPIVILADAAKTRWRDQSAWLSPQSKDMFLRKLARAALPDAAGALADAEQIRGLAERKRLLYVAMTRAKSELILTGTFRPKEDGDALEGSWYRAVEEILSPDAKFVRARGDFQKIRFGAPEVFASSQEALRAPESTAYGAMPAWARMPPVPEAPSLRRTPSGLTAAEAGLLRHGSAAVAGLRSRRRGSLVHRLLEFLPDIEIDRREAAARAFLERFEPGLAAAERQALAASVLQILDDPRFAFAFGPGSLPEVPLAGRLRAKDGREILISGQIDRLVHRDDEVLIIDFKSDAAPPRSLDEIQAAYWSQMAAYAMLLQEIDPGRTVRAALLFTAGPELVALPPERLSVAAVTVLG